MTVLMRVCGWVAVGVASGLAGCGGGGGSTVTAPPQTYVLTVNSTNPASGVMIAVAPADNLGFSSGLTGFTQVFNAGTTVTLSAPAKAGGNAFASWSGCTTASTVTCTVLLIGNATVTATYTAPVVGKTYYVSGAGSDSADGLTMGTAFLTLQHAANLTQPGDTVYAMNGTYTNSCAGCDVLDITTAGTDNGWITYKAYPGQTPLISFNGWNGILVEKTAAYIEVNGFSVEGNNYNVTLAGALAQSYTTPDPAYNGNCIATDGRTGTATQRVHHVRILNNTAWACGGGGVGTAQSDYVTIQGNTIYDSSWYSIYGGSPISTWENWDSDSVTGYKMYVIGNRILNNQELVPVLGAGEITDGEGVIVDSTRNSSYQPSIGLPPYQGRTLIANNVIYGNGSSAIEVFESDHVDIVNNASYQNVTTPVLSGRGELFLNNTSDVNAVNNIFDCATGQNPVTALSNTSAILLDYNLYFGGTNFAGTVSGAHDLTGDPLYVDPADANRFNVLLSVSPTSPAVGSGTANLAPATDFVGNPRPGAKGYDRGAYQSQ
jgi:hypothetical protein